MQKLTFSLLKQITLLAALGVTTSYLFFYKPSGNTLLMLQVGLGVLYLFFSVMEFSGKMEKMSLPFDRFFYLPFSVVSDKLIWLGALSIAAVVLFFSQSRLVTLAVLLFIKILADVIVFALKMKRKVYYISLFANYVLISLEHEQKIFASSIESVEFRYDIFYLKLKDKKTASLITDRLSENEKQLFTEKFVQWALQNNLSFTEEAKQKLAV